MDKSHAISPGIALYDPDQRFGRAFDTEFSVENTVFDLIIEFQIINFIDRLKVQFKGFVISDELDFIVIQIDGFDFSPLPTIYKIIVVRKRLLINVDGRIAVEC